MAEIGRNGHHQLRDATELVVGVFPQAAEHHCRKIGGGEVTVADLIHRIRAHLSLEFLERAGEHPRVLLGFQPEDWLLRVFLGELHGRVGEREILPVHDDLRLTDLVESGHDGGRRAQVDGEYHHVQRLPSKSTVSPESGSRNVPLKTPFSS